jgi:hypothetical protein
MKMNENEEDGWSSAWNTIMEQYSKSMDDETRTLQLADAV